MMTILEKNIRELRKYTNEHQELKEAHHFTYDLSLNKETNNIEYLVMGMNPGEQPRYSWDIFDGPTEETNLYDFFVDVGYSRTETDWSRRCINFLGTNEINIGNFFFWSSRNTDNFFKERFGFGFNKTGLRYNPHFHICQRMNIDLIEHYQPRLIAAPGITLADWIPEIYGMNFIQTMLKVQVTQI